MSLLLSEATHFSLSILLGFIIYRKAKNVFLSFLPVLITSFFIDADHLIDYFIAFGFSFNLEHFLKGYSFQKLDKIYLFFHGWEYIIVFLLIFLLLKNKNIRFFFLSLALGLLLHLFIDLKTNNMFFSSYSIIKRYQVNFEMERLVSKEHWERHLREKTI